MMPVVMSFSNCSFKFKNITTVEFNFKKTERSFEESMKIFYDFAKYVNGKKPKNNFYKMKGLDSLNYFPAKTAHFQDSVFSLEKYLKGKSLHKLKKEYETNKTK